MMRPGRSLLAAVVLTAALACGRSWKADLSSPEAAWRSFDRAMREGRFELAAQCYAYEAISRLRNPDWDNIPSLQRRQVTGKIAEAMEQALAQQSYDLPQDFQVEAQGDEARVLLAGRAIVLRRTSEGWKILEGYPVPMPF